jgi:hypothetical protein
MTGTSTFTSTPRSPRAATTIFLAFSTDVTTHTRREKFRGPGRYVRADTTGLDDLLE